MPKTKINEVLYSFRGDYFEVAFAEFIFGSVFFMIYMGVDIAKLKHCAIAVDEKGHELCKAFPFENTEDGFNSFFAIVSDFMSTDSVCIAMEATGHYWLNLYEIL